jgi:hypothetical protein
MAVNLALKMRKEKEMRKKGKKDWRLHWLGFDGTSLISVILDKSRASLPSESEPSDSSSSASVSIFKRSNINQQCHKSKGDKVAKL